MCALNAGAGDGVCLPSLLISAVGLVMGCLFFRAAPAWFRCFAETYSKYG